MASYDSVSQNTQDYFSSYRVSNSTGVPLTATGNAIVALPILSGGLTATTGQFILRRITISNPSNIAGGTVPNCAACNVSITTSNDGNTSNAVAAAQTIANVTGQYKYQDLTLASSTLTTAQTANTLFLNIGAGAVANGSVTVSIFGDVVQF